MGNKVKTVLQGKAKDLGDNFQVRRALPQAHNRMVGPFIFWDHMGPTEITPSSEMVVHAHPHIGLSTITYLFSGQILHRDSLNNELFILPGEVNWMTAGRGIAHSERSHIAEGSRPLEGIQVWVALPQEAEEVEPSFIHQKEKDLPLIDHQGFQLRLIAGEALGEKSPLPVYSPLFYLAGHAQQAQSMTFPIASGQQGAVYVTKGTLQIEGKSYDKFSMIVFENDTDLEFSCQGPCEFMILGGEIFPEGRHIWWNFVSSSKEKIEEAKVRWTKNEFGSVINETDRTKLPEV